MAKSLITFSRTLSYSLRDLAKAHRTFRARAKQFQPKQNSAFVAMAKTPEDGIPARVGLVFGSAECTFAYLNEDDELTDGDENEVELVYNPYFFDIPGEFYIDVNREVFSGRLVASLKGGFPVFLNYGDTITARAGTVLGSGTVDLYGQDDDDLVDLNKSVLIYNDTQQTPVNTDVFLQAKINASGYLMWDVDDCTQP